MKSPLTSNQSVSYRPLIYSLGRDIVLNATIPVACYYLSKIFISSSELTALILATTFPTFKSICEAMRHQGVNPVSILVLLGIVTSIIAFFVGGNPRILLIRESLFTGIFGLACLASLLSRRPLMFYFGRYLMAGNDPERRKRLESGWDIPAIRRGHRLITTVWGFVYLGEFIVRVILVYTLPAAGVLAVTPFLLGMATILTIIWTFRYVQQLRGRIGQYPVQRS